MRSNFWLILMPNLNYIIEVKTLRDYGRKVDLASKVSNLK